MKLLVISIVILLLLSQNHLSQIDCNGKAVLTEKSCIGDNLSDPEKELFNLVNDYREANKLNTIPVSENLCLVANRHALDLQKNIRKLTHDWSDCVINPADPQSDNCVYQAPKRFNPSFNGLAFENAYVTSRKTVSNKIALEMWKKSPLHNSLMLNLTSHKNISYNGGCVGIAGNYAVLWFDADFNSGLVGKSKQNPIGLGVSFDEAIKGLKNIIPITQESSTIESNRWVGRTPFKSVILEMLGTEDDIQEGNISLRLKLEKDTSLSVVNKHILKTFLTNMSPKWSQRNHWLENALKKMRLNPQVVQGLDIQNLNLEMSLTPDKYLVLKIKPSTKPIPIEF